MFSKKIHCGRTRIGDYGLLLSLKNGWGEQIEKFHINSNFVDSLYCGYCRKSVSHLFMLGRADEKNENLNPNSCSLNSVHCLLPFPKLKSFSV